MAGERLARQALELGKLAGQPDALQIFGEHRALVRTYQGRGDEQLIELSRQAADAHPRMAVWSASTAQYEAHFGSREAARALLRDARREPPGAGRLGHAAARRARVLHGGCRHVCSARDAAALVHELMTPWQDQFVWSGAARVRPRASLARGGGRDAGAGRRGRRAFRVRLPLPRRQRPEVVVGSIASRLGGGARGQRRASASAGARVSCARARTRVRLRPDRGPGRADRGRRSSCRQLM